MGYYPWRIEGKEINVKPILDSILKDLANLVEKPIISSRFHNTIAKLSLNIAQVIRREYNIDHFVLSGGVWQNQLLLERTVSLFNKNGIKALVHEQMPPNDGCVAFGQALITAYRYLKDKE